MRRGDPERIYQAQRAGVFQRLVDLGRLDELDAEYWISRWERVFSELGVLRSSHAFWDAVSRWIAAQHRLGRRSDASKTDTGAKSDDGHVYRS